MSPLCESCGNDINEHHGRCPRVSGDAFIKNDDGKPRTDLLPPRAVLQVAAVLAYGARKYAPNNWRKVDDLGRYTAAALRHVFAYMTGERTDPESGCHHLACAACSLLFVIELEEEKKGRP